jgi:hypothetical protein
LRVHAPRRSVRSIFAGLRHGEAIEGAGSDVAAAIDACVRSRTTLDEARAVAPSLATRERHVALFAQGDVAVWRGRYAP